MAKKSNPGEFTLTLIDESQPTVDGRVFEPGTVEWREPPLSLMFLTENVGEGHKGSRVGASITEIWRDGTKIKGRGTFASNDDGQAFRRMVEEGVLNGVSADVGGAVVEQELAEDGSPQSRIMSGRIMGATVLPFPAFDDTRIAVVAAAVPAEPPASWFTDPGLAVPTPLTVSRDGQVFGHAALWNSCHIGRPGSCLTPPRSGSDYAYFRTGEILTADHGPIACGPITLGTGHAGLTLNSRQATEHYDHTGTAIADVVTGEDQHGIWVAGAIRPDATDERLRCLRASALSGDWRTINGKLELVALLAVNTPGFPVPRTRATFADEEPLALVAAGVATDTEVLAMKTDMGTGGPMKKDPRTDHNDPTSQHNVARETPTNAPDDDDREPITEPVAAGHRRAVKEFADAQVNDAPCVDCESEEELSDTEIQELTARIDALERAIVSLASNRFAMFTAENPELFAAAQEA